MSTSETELRNILVIGATGKQGRAFISAALASPSTTGFHILALTRNSKSESAKSLSYFKEKLTVVEADLDKPESVRSVFQDQQGRGGIWGMFVVLAFPGLGADATGEEKQGKLCADLALEFKVQHFIFSSVERGGEAIDGQLMLDRRAKVQIEQHIKSLEGLRWTVLRPAFFMENFDGVIGRITTSVLAVGLKKETKLQLVAAPDIGCIALAVFQAPDKHRSQAIVVVGDALTTQEISEAYIRGAGKPLPTVPAFVSKSLLAINKHTKELIADIERVHVDRAALPESTTDLIVQCQALYPDMQSLEAWARASGRKKDRTRNWNNVAVGELVKGKR